MLSILSRLFSIGKSPVNQLPAIEFNQRISVSSPVNIIDVRSAAEYKSGHLPKAKNINVNHPEFAERVSKLDKSLPTFVYCRSGARSNMAAKLLVKAGFKAVHNLQGGMLRWNGKIER